jgi:hypothetical protein
MLAITYITPTGGTLTMRRVAKKGQKNLIFSVSDNFSQHFGILQLSNRHLTLNPINMIRSIFALLTQRQLCLIAVGPFNYGDL